MYQTVFFLLGLGVCLGGSLAADPVVPDRGVLILDYHTFLDSKTSSFDFSLDELAEQLDAITALGYRFVSIDDAIQGRITGTANIVVSIDDGNHSVYAAYQKVLGPRGIKPVLFIYPAVVLGHVPYALTPDRLIELAGEGCTIGAHGYHHNRLSSRAFALDPKDFMAEIQRPGPALNRLLGTTPTLFAYPFDLYGPEAEQALAKEHYQWAFTATSDPVWVRFDDPLLDPMAVPRVIVYRWNHKLILKALAKELKRETGAASL